MWVKNRKNILIDVKGSREVNQIKRSFLSIFWGIPTYITGGNKDVWILRKTASHGIVINRDGSEMWWLYVSSWWYFLSSLMKGFLNHNFPGLETNYQGNKQLQHNYITKFPGNIVFGLLIRWSHMYPFTSLSVSLCLSLSVCLSLSQIYAYLCMPIHLVWCHSHICTDMPNDTHSDIKVVSRSRNLLLMSVTRFKVDQHKGLNELNHDVSAVK